ncbi:MAG: hypothetical protein JWQ35_644 [Bacteriovoracaceae bacterium]|nr:hypothetical protein [Bacteriovoracaceae bacterium]
MEINFTLVIQIGIYLVLFFILKAYYFKPILALLKKRESLTVGKLDEVSDLTKKMEGLRAEYESRMKAARESMESHRMEALQRIRQNSEEKIHQAKIKLEKSLSDHQEALEREAKIIRTKFATLAVDLKKEIEGAILSSRVVRL